MGGWEIVRYGLELFWKGERWVGNNFFDILLARDVGVSECWIRAVDVRGLGGVALNMDRIFGIAVTG